MFNNLFSRIYEPFHGMGFYSSDLHMHLNGYDCEKYVTEDALFGTFGLIVLIGSIFCAIAFYYIINHPRFNTWVHWIMVLLFDAFLFFLIPYIKLRDNLEAGKICENLTVSNADINGFAFVNAILGILLFIVASFAIRWWSRNASCTPYPL